MVIKGDVQGHLGVWSGRNFCFFAADPYPPANETGNPSRTATWRASWMAPLTGGAVGRTRRAPGAQACSTVSIASASSGLPSHRLPTWTTSNVSCSNPSWRLTALASSPSSRLPLPSPSVGPRPPPAQDRSVDEFERHAETQLSQYLQ